MKLKILLLSFCFLGCKSSTKVKNLIQGKWYFEDNVNTNAYIHISDDEYTVENDSPYSEDYKIIGDTLIVKGVEAKFRESAKERGYVDTVRILKITENRMILKDGKEILKLHKK